MHVKLENTAQEKRPENLMANFSLKVLSPIPICVEKRAKLFFSVCGIVSMTIPFPPQQTVFSCTLNNGIHFVTTPEARFCRNAEINQEFEL